MSDTDELGRRVDLLAGEIRDLVHWLKEDQAKRLTKIEEEIALARHELGGHADQLATLRIDVHQHGIQIRALQGAQKPVTRKKARK